MKLQNSQLFLKLLKEKSKFDSDTGFGEFTSRASQKYIGLHVLLFCRKSYSRSKSTDGKFDKVCVFEFLPERYI